MLLLWLLLLLPLLAMLWQQRPSWLILLQHQVAWRALAWVAAWQQRKLEQSTLRVGQSQLQALMWCLKRAQSPCCLPRGITDMSTFRNRLPLTKTSQVQEEESEEQLPPSASAQFHGEASLQATVLGLVTLNKAYPEVFSPGSTACVTPTSPWPSSVPWLGHALGRVSPIGAKDTRTLLLEALMSPGLRALEARTAVELLDVFVGLEAVGKELTEAVAAGNLGTPLPSRAAQLQEAMEQGPRGVMALNLWPEQPQGSYLLLPGVPFIELLPIKEGTQEEAASTLLLTDVQREEEYELVLTDHASLTRCRLGDVVQVVGAYNQCPVVRFTRRLGQTLSVRGEVTYENIFSAALAQAVGQWPGAKLLDYACVESSILDSCDGSAPHYEVFMELKGLRNLSEENRDKLDHCLQEVSPHYKSLRLRGSVGPVKVHLVGPGSFRVLREALAACPSSSSPPEMPRVLRLSHLAQLLQKRMIS
ncbi:GH3 domain-containing protein isoform X2 [Arvicola amphibius]|uniref:GH3 domain-containing protein isoform X2 n=1 Tax=Arvicola amphibius TaxID=1047088 RepID=UPI0018E36F71|nr:GH3 domain-containing protein isoform X2 [Arvicola amphibius]